MLDSVNLKILEKGLDAASLRQQVAANNLANIDTPGFKQSSVAFEDLLAKSLQSADPNNPASLDQAANVNPVMQTDNSTSLRSDGNNVDVDQQMTELAKNGLYYDSLVQQISSQLAILRTVISEKP